MLPESRVVAILFAAARITSGHLKVAVLVRADPHIGPRRRNYERFESLDRVSCRNDSAVGSDIRKAATLPMPANSRHRVAYISESRGGGGSHVFMGNGLSQLSPSRSTARIASRRRTLKRDVAIWTRRKRGGNRFTPRWASRTLLLRVALYDRSLLPMARGIFDTLVGANMSADGGTNRAELRQR